MGGYVNDTGLPSVTEILSPHIETAWFTEEHARRGSMVHAACGGHLLGNWVPLPAEYRCYFDSFRSWADTNIDQVVLVEKRLCDHDLGYTGQPDAVLIIKGDTEPSLWDWKTSQAYCPWWRIQGGAYRSLALKNDIITHRGGSLRLKKDGSMALVNQWPDSHWGDYNIFVGLLNAHKFFKGGK